ncbi:TPA: ORF6N domain-containing protein [Salmonella enterica]|nr:ORF6N domain-containing protein [Salmonella enterica]HEA0262713.1 ORF6N domain-containing protein [Salmonella enterica]HEA0267276.1 ORF6N domain-containing protein [Salmonella enterica]HEA0294593.1 ORF6N domain-containing protein [Salmonella enterica]HEA0301673.1 ORF6N domain-containing protein [Salmonella enterica]
MADQITAETLSPISHNQTPVITTELLARLYGTDAHSITKNHRSNVDRFIAGKHFYKLEGSELKAFKNKVTNSDLVANRAKHLILWTERGAARHAKMLETDQAWEVFEKLEDCYFSQKEKSPAPARPSHRHNAPTFRYIITLTYKDMVTGQEETFRGGANSPDEIIQGTAKRFGMYITEMIAMPVNAYC